MQTTENTKTEISTGLPFSEAVRAGNLLFISGQIGIPPGSDSLVRSDGIPVHDGFIEEAAQVMRNLGSILKKYQLDYKDLVGVTIYLTEMSHYADTNEVYKRYFDKTYPARVCIAVKELPLQAAIEISAIAQFSV